MNYAMARPYKRQRLSDPPELALHQRREQNDLRLKSTFESIFDKYGKDFDGIGDEIDLETGEIIVNNGHILGMVNERDAGDLDTDSEVGEGDDWSDGEMGLTSSLLSEMRRRIDVLEDGMAYEEGRFIDGELQSENESDSLLGSNDSLVGDDEALPASPAPRAKPRSPDSLYDDEEEDELASSEMEWPTPGRAWPTPAKTTPLGHTPWHSSPRKPVYKSDTVVDPAWRAPPLPIDGEQPSLSKPVDLNTSHEANVFTNHLSKEHAGQHCPSRVSDFRTPLRQKASFTGSHRDIKSLSHQRTSNGLKSMTLSCNTERVWSPRWTTAEDNLLRQLRTTTTLMYKEMQPYFPGRRTQALMTHWSEMTRNEGDVDQLYESMEYGTTVLSPRHKFSASKRFLKSPAAARCVKSGLGGKSPTPKPVVSSSVGSRASHGPHYRAVSHPRIKQESPPQYSSLEIANTSDPMEQSQGGSSSSPAAFTSSRISSTIAERCKSPKDESEEEGHEAQGFATSLPLSGVGTALRDTANAAPRLTPQSFHAEGSKSRSTNSKPRVDYMSRETSATTPSVGRASSSQEYLHNSLKRTFQQSSYRSDGSEDELSAPIKTVGLQRNQFQRASSSTLAEHELNRSSSSISRNG